MDVNRFKDDTVTLIRMNISLWKRHPEKFVLAIVVGDIILAKNKLPEHNLDEQ